MKKKSKNKPQQAVRVFDKRTNQYQDKFMDASISNYWLDMFCSKITTSAANILELACGPGDITKYMLTKRPDFKVFGIDLDPNMIGLAKINNPSGDFQVMDCREIGKLNKRYDGIMCGFGLTYLSFKLNPIGHFLSILIATIFPKQSFCSV